MGKHSAALSVLVSLALFAQAADPPRGERAGEAPKIIRLPHEGHRTSVAFAPDGKTLATGGFDNHIRIWDFRSGKVRSAFRAHAADAGISRLAYLPGGATLVSGSWAGDGTVKLWDVAKEKESQTIGKDVGGISFVAVSPDGAMLAWGNGGTVHLHNLAAGREARRLSVASAVDSVAFSPDGKALATANGDGTVRIWDVATGKPRRDLAARQTVATGSQAVAFAGDALLVTASGKARLWNVATGEEVAAFGPADEVAFCIAISPDGRHLAAGTFKALRVWDMKTRKEVHSWLEAPVSLAFSPDGAWVAFGSRDGQGAGLLKIGTPAK
jgi:WD40 repeat protein